MTPRLEMQIYFPPSLRYFEPKRMVFSTWTDHMPFGYDLIEAFRPRCLVELGAYAGQSYFTFCQSVKEHELETACYAVDTWEGDKHTQKYGEDIHASAAAHNEEEYAAFSTLLRMTFEEAAARFEPESIDLIHLDGLHTYAAVSNDFEVWYPKLKPGGLFLFHDIAARMQDFGAWRVWEELTREHETFAFHHGFGLGVLRKQGGDPDESQLLRALFGSPDEQQCVRAFYVYASRFKECERKVRRIRRIAARRRAEGAAKRKRAGV